MERELKIIGLMKNGKRIRKIREMGLIIILH